MKRIFFFKEASVGLVHNVSVGPPCEWSKDRGATHTLYCKDGTRPVRMHHKTKIFVGIDENPDNQIKWEEWKGVWRGETPTFIRSLPKTFKVIKDPGHAWAEVPLNILKVLEIDNEISSYSYYNKETDKCYLEEDLDLSVFMVAYEKYMGEKPSFATYFRKKTFIRDLPSVTVIQN